jgi:hypothetical protein
MAGESQRQAARSAPRFQIAAASLARSPSSYFRAVAELDFSSRVSPFDSASFAVKR